MDKSWTKLPASNARGFPMARPPRSFHLQPINGGLRNRLSVPADVQGTLGKKVFYTSVFRVPENEAAKLAWPEVQKFEAMIEWLIDAPWVGELDDVTLRDGVSLLHWRSGGVEHNQIRRPTSSSRQQFLAIALV
jgi:hypothetical protein